VKRLSETSYWTAPSRRTLAELVSEVGTRLRLQEQSRRQELVVLALVLSDVLLAFLVWEVAFVFQSILGRGPLSELGANSILIDTILWVGVRKLLGLYPGYGLDEAEELRRQIYAVGATLAIISIFALAFQVAGSFSRLLLALGFLGLLFFAPILRYWVKQGLRRIGLWGKPVVILGAGEAGVRLLMMLQKEWSLGYRPVAVFDNHLFPVREAFRGAPLLETLTDVQEVARDREADTAIFAMPGAHHDDLIRFVEQASGYFRNIIVIADLPNLARVTSSAIVARELAGTFGVEIKRDLIDAWAQRARRALDLSRVGRYS
jgi:FlaA1/EpsC-like NDP-sugar epimerase